MVVAEVAHSGHAKKGTEAALVEIKLLQGKSWITAARQLVSHIRAATGDEARPHASEEVYFMRYVWVRQVAELCERAVNVFFTCGPDRNGMEPLLIHVGMHVVQCLTPVQVEAGKPLDPYMLHGGDVSHGIFHGVINALFTRCTHSLLATIPTTGRSRGIVAVLS